MLEYKIPVTKPYKDREELTRIEEKFRNDKINFIVVYKSGKYSIWRSVMKGDTSAIIKPKAPDSKYWIYESKSSKKAR